jgi:hypothetical protein
MDAARTVLRRLRRIEALEREGAPARWLLTEVHALVEEAEAWLAAEGIAAEGGGGDLAEAAVARCREALVGRAGVRVGERGEEAAMR